MPHLSKLMLSALQQTYQAPLALDARALERVCACPLQLKIDERAAFLRVDVAVPPYNMA